MEPHPPQPDGEEEEWQRWRAKRARLREERAREEMALHEQFGEAKGAVINHLLVVCVAVGIINFLIFNSVRRFAGGAAENGKIEDGRFYVGDHGNYTEVSKEFFDYSRIHGVWTYRVFVATVGCVVLLGIRKAKEQERREQILRRLNQQGYPLPLAVVSGGQSDSVQATETKTGHKLRMALFSVAMAAFFIAAAVHPRPIWFLLAFFFAALLCHELRGWRG